MRFGRSVSKLAVLLSVVACNSPTSPDSSLQDGSLVESRSFELVNTARSDHSADEVDLRAKLTQVARQHSLAMRDEGQLTHLGANGDTVRERLLAANVDFRSAGENIAFIGRVTSPAAQVHDLLMNNPSHRLNILEPGWELAGIGVATAPEGYWITQVFIKP